jgi:putative ABC transport system substrate-binding protein
MKNLGISTIKDSRILPINYLNTQGRAVGNRDASDRANLLQSSVIGLMNLHYRCRYLTLPLALLLIVPALFVPALAHSQTVVVLSVDTLTSTTRTISGCKAVVSGEFPSAQFVQMVLPDDAAARQRLLDSAAKCNPAAILAVGSLATQIAQTNFPKSPIVFSSVMYPVISGFVKSMNAPGGNTTGASLTIAPDIQFKYFKRIVPGLKTIGVLYSPNTASLIPPSNVVAQELGFRLVALQVHGERELPRALDSLARSCDGIWSLADPILFSPQATKYILLNTLKSGKPFMGFSRNVVESGALFALDFDYKAIGRQAGAQIAQILHGVQPGDIPVASPDIIWFHYNENTAQRLGINMPKDLVAIAKEVYR